MAKPLISFCQYYTVVHQTRQSWDGRIYHHSPQLWKFQGKLVPKGRWSHSWEPHHHFRKDLRMVDWAWSRARRSRRRRHVRFRGISTFTRNVPHHWFFSIRALNPRIGVNFYAGTNDKEQVSRLYSDGLLWLMFRSHQVVIIPVVIGPDPNVPYWLPRPHQIH